MIRHMLLAAVLMCGAFTLQAAETIDINHADAQTISKGLAGIGPAKARAIVKYREEYGPFASADELAEVKGIGEKTVEKIRDKISVSTTDED